jgi:beta-glucosidase
VVDAEEAITCAVAMAKSSDVAVIVVGLNQDWESESYDRPTLSLPLRSDELINRVADGAPDTKIVVVAQTGSAISMPWLDKVDSVVYSWYGGNEAGNGIADIIYGTVNPSGRLPLTLPRSEDDIAAHLNRRSVRTKIHYDEGIWVGYKHHNARHIEPLFPFGHGLSYTQFDYSGLKLQHQGSTAEEWTLRAEITVINSGSVAGAHSVHFYTSPPPPTSTSLEHPAHSLQAFTKTTVLKPGESETVVVEMDKCEFRSRSAR